MTSALEYVRTDCGMAGEEVADMVDALEAELKQVKQQRDELLAAINQAVMDLQAIKLCLPSRDTGFAETAITRLVEAGGKT